MLDKDVPTNVFIIFSMESSEVFSAMFELQKKSKENIKQLDDSFEASAKEEQEKKKKEYLLYILFAQKQEIERQIKFLVLQVTSLDE